MRYIKNIWKEFAHKINSKGCDVIHDVPDGRCGVCSNSFEIQSVTPIVRDEPKLNQN